MAAVDDSAVRFMKYVSLTDPWLYAAAAASAGSAVVSVLAGKWIAQWIGLIIVVAAGIADQLTYQKALRSEPWFHLGFYPCVVVPVVSYAILLCLIIVFVIRALFGGSNVFLALYATISVLLFFVKVTFGLAYASPAAAILIGVDLVFLIVRLVLRPKEQSKDKQD